jgi:hypothetical protein
MKGRQALQLEAESKSRRTNEMKKVILSLLAALAALPAGCFGQLPDGSDINKAIPIYFDQLVADIGDSGTVPHRVYSITLAKGQQLTATMTLPTGTAKYMELTLLEPTRLSVAGVGYAGNKGGLATNYGEARAVTFTYEVASSATYYLLVTFGSPGVNYELQVKAVGTPIVTPPPPCAGSLTGQVDSITYSLQLIAAGLPDEASIGGTKLCAGCTVKAPAYPQLVAKMETAMGLNVGVSACYDATGNIVQLKMLHP